MKRKDPQGIPNVCFSLISERDSRNKAFKKQRLERGFDDSETWCLDLTIAKFIIPRLERFIEISEKVNEKSKKHETFMKNLRKSLLAFQKIVKGNGCVFALPKKEQDEIQKGVSFLADNLMSLGW
jgi:hypothetical protein